MHDKIWHIFIIMEPKTGARNCHWISGVDSSHRCHRSTKDKEWHMPYYKPVIEKLVTSLSSAHSAMLILSTAAIIAEDFSSAASAALILPVNRKPKATAVLYHHQSGA